MRLAVVVVWPDRVWVKQERCEHAHRHTQYERDDRWPELKFDHRSELHQHDHERQEHDIHHAPLSDMLHDAISNGFVPFVKDAEQAQFDEQYEFDQRKHDREEQHDSANKPAAVLHEFERAHQDARFVLVSELFNVQDW